MQIPKLSALTRTVWDERFLGRNDQLAETKPTWLETASIDGGRWPKRGPQEWGPTPEQNASGGARRTDGLIQPRGLVNINLNQIACDYLLCDASDKVCLDNIERHYGDDNILFCHYGYFFEIDFYENINCITKFRIAKDKADFDKSLLTEKKLSRPNKLVNCLSFLVNFFASLKK